MTVTDEMLIAYADGEADAETRAVVEAAVAADPALAQRLAAHQAMRARFAKAFAGVMDEPVPQALIDRIADDGKVVSLPARPSRSARWLVGGGAVAAAAFFSIWFMAGGPNLRSTDPYVLANNPALRNALDTQMASDDQNGLPVRIGVSFRSGDGSYCRTYLQNTDGRAGLACRTSKGWREVVAVATDSRNTEYRTAAAMPPQVAKTMEALISGEPLDAKAEQAARDRGWR